MPYSINPHNFQILLNRIKNPWVHLKKKFFNKNKNKLKKLDFILCIQAEI